MDMLGPGSLRSQQPLRPSLKTYGRNKKSLASTASSSTHTAVAEGHARLFDWTRLENERRARYNARLSARKAAEASSRRAEAQLYSDLDQLDSMEDLDDIEMPRHQAAHLNNSDSIALDLGLDYNEQDSFSYSDSVLEQTKRHKHRPKFNDNPEIIPSTQTSESDDNNDEDYPFRPVHMASKDNKQSQKQVEPQHVQKAAGRKHPSLVPEKNFAEQEQEQEQEQEEEQKGNAPDVVDIVNEPALLRSLPTIDIRQRLLSIPRPRFSKPQANTFSRVTGDSSRENSSSPTRSETSYSFQSPTAAALSESLSLIRTPPRSWKEQMADLRRFRSGETSPPNRIATTSASIDGPSSNAQPASQTQPFTAFAERELISDTRGAVNPLSLLEGSSGRQISELDVPSVPKEMPPRAVIDMLSDTDSSQERGKNVNLEFSAGKRMSTIQITPQRMQAKLPRVSSSPPPSPPSRPVISPFASEAGINRLRSQPKPLNLFLNRDIPDNEKDDMDVLFESFRAKKAVENQQLEEHHDRFVSSLVGSGRHSLPQKNHCSRSTQETRRDPVDLPSQHQDMKPPRKLQQTQKCPRDPSPVPPLQSVPEQSGATAQSSSPRLRKQEDTITAPSQQPQAQRNQSADNLPSTRPNARISSLRKPLPRIPRTLHSVPKPQPTASGPQPTASKPLATVSKPPPTASNPPPIPKPVHSSTGNMISTGHIESMRADGVEHLLEICNQGFFDQFQLGNSGDSTPTMSDQILDFGSVLPTSMIRTLSKIGEASYSEVFTIEIPAKDSPSCRRPTELDPPGFDKYVRNFRRDANTLFLSRANKSGSSIGPVKKTPLLTMKVIPFTEGAGQASRSTGKSRHIKDGSLADMDILGLQDIYREVMVSTQVIHDWPGFIGSFGAMIVKGRYPKHFLNAWDQYRKEYGTESVRPHVFKEDQLFCIIMLPYGGMDLEHYPITNWQQAWTVLSQVAGSLQAREQESSWFEHRDLHWGNILVKETHFQTWSFPMGKDNGGLIYMDMEKDTDLFRGQGDYQFDVYRKMRKLVNKDWSASDPRTNVFWLHYIADKLLLEKKLEPPATRSAYFETVKKGSSKNRRKKALARSLPVTPSATTTPQDVERDLFEEQWDETRFTEEWCFDRIWAVSQLNMDRFDQWTGSLPHLRSFSASGAVLQLLLDLA